jgi:hypothetical protein
MLYNFVVDVLSRMLIKGSSNGMVKGICPNLVHGGVVFLQYTYDTLVFLEKNKRTAINSKWTLACFEQIQGMKIT